MEKLNKDIQIDRYVTGKLDDAELWEFKQEMEKTPGWQKKLSCDRQFTNPSRTSKN